MAVRTTTATTSAWSSSNRRARLTSPRRRRVRRAASVTPASVPPAGTGAADPVHAMNECVTAVTATRNVMDVALVDDSTHRSPGAVMASGTAVEHPPPAARKDRTHWLYIAVIAAVLLGIAVGFAFPEFAVSLKWLGTAFVGLIKMLIAPVIFCTIVLGIGAIRQAAKVGRIGGLALGYFLLMSTVALTIGLIVGNLLHPGA